MKDQYPEKFIVDEKDAITFLKDNFKSQDYSIVQESISIVQRSVFMERLKQSEPKRLTR